VGVPAHAGGKVVTIGVPKRIDPGIAVLFMSLPIGVAVPTIQSRLLCHSVLSFLILNKLIVHSLMVNFSMYAATKSES
jgi:hypothetical protein